jgi:hypothetical protein
VSVQKASYVPALLSTTKSKLTNLQGPTSHLSSPLPTSCFTDTILIPLPIYIYLLALPTLYLLHHFTHSPTSLPAITTLRQTPKKTWALKATKIAYYTFIAVTILMETLEIVRLFMIHYAVGLLPFIYVGLLLGAFTHYTSGFAGRVPYWRYANVIVLWIGGFVVTIVKVAGLAMEENGKGEAEGRGKYPMGDQITDVAVMAGVYLIIALLEVMLGVWGTGKVFGKGKTKETESLCSNGAGDVEVVGLHGK